LEATLMARPCDIIPGRYPWPWSVDAIEPDLRGEVHQHDAAGASSTGDYCPGDRQHFSLAQRLNALGSVKPGQ
jgi:hypothetical protein